MAESTNKKQKSVFATFDMTRGSSVYMPELKQNFLEEFIGKNQQARITLAQKMKRNIEENERIFKSSFPSIVKLEEQEKFQELQALKQSFEIEKKRTQNEEEKSRRKLALTMECREQQLSTINQINRFSIRSKDVL